MHLEIAFELSMVLDSENFDEVFSNALKKSSIYSESENRFIDLSLQSKGITITYRDSQYKKKIKLLVNQNLLLSSNEPDPDRLINKLDKQIIKYFDSRFGIEDFVLVGMTLVANIDVRSRDNVSAYLKVLQRVGKVKGFSPASYDGLDDANSFCLSGNSNGIEFLIFDLEALLKEQIECGEATWQKLQTIKEQAKGILRAEVRLAKPKSIRAYTDEFCATGQITALSNMYRDVFLDTFMRIVPYGDFYKKDKALEIIRKEIRDQALRRRMIRLVTLVPEKKSLHLAQKELGYRKIDKVMKAFSGICLSPVTVSKRQEEKHLKDLYAFLLNE